MKWADNNNNKKMGLMKAGQLTALRGAHWPTKGSTLVRGEKDREKSFVGTCRELIWPGKKKKIKKRNGIKEMKNTLYNLKSTINKKTRKPKRHKTRMDKSWGGQKRKITCSPIVIY